MTIVQAIVTNNRLPQLVGTFGPAVAAAMNRTVQDLDAAQKAGITPRETGKLADTTQMHFARSENDTARLDWTQDYAGYVNDGTRYMEGRQYMERAMATVEGRVQQYFAGSWG